MSNVFITSASGNIGSELVPLLIHSPAIKTLLLPTSNATRLRSSLPSSDKTIVLEGSIQDPQWLESQFERHEVDTVFLNLTGTDELFTTMNFLSSIQRSQSRSSSKGGYGGVKHLVYLSACGNFLSPDFASTVLRQCLAPHVIVKVISEQALQATRPVQEEKGFSWTVVGPTLFMENDRRAKGAMMAKGFFPEPIGRGGVSRVACRDIALGVAKAIEDRGKVWDRKKVMIGTKETYTADDVAKLYSTALGKPITVQPSDDAGLDAVEKHFSEHIGPAWGRDLRLMYQVFNDQCFDGKGFAFSDEEYENQKKLLGREPRNYEEFVEAEVEAWTQKE